LRSRSARRGNRAAAGALLGKTRTSDLVDATVATLAARYGADVVTSDASDLRKLLTALGAKSSVLGR
jgi:predicted nucleic acid-binding protein